MAGCLQCTLIPWHRTTHNLSLHVQLAGMAALFTVEGTPLTDAQLQLNGRVREYYIAAELITWDYAPLGTAVLELRENIFLLLGSTDSCCCACV